MAKPFTSCRILALAGLMLIVSTAAAAASPASRPNVLLIVCDDLNTSIGHLGGLPQAHTPHIDELAKSGVSFTRAYSNDPVCAPSRSSFLTGIYPHSSGNLFFNKWFENPVLANSKTLMEHFRDNGYRVVGSGKVMHHERRSDWDEFPHAADYGPFVFDGTERIAHPSVPEPFRSIGPVDGSFGPLTDLSKEKGGTPSWIYGAWGQTKPMRYNSEEDRDPTPDEKVATWAAERLRKFAAEDEANPKAEPFFMAVGFIRPHTPMHAPQKYFDMFPLESLILPVIKPGDIEDTHYRSVFDDEVKGLRYFRLLGESYPSVEDGLKAYVQAYLACVAAVDDTIGTVLQAVEQSPLRDNTIVILTSDHGWNNGEKDYLFKNSPWEESTRIPLIMRAPGVSASGKLAGHPVSLIDLYPTLVDLCDLRGETTKSAAGKPLDGHSLRPFLEDPATSKWSGSDSALSMIFAGENSKTPRGPNQLKDPAFQHWSVRTERWRYIRYNNGREELYDHDADPHEWTNVATAPEFVEVLASMQARLPFPQP